MATFSGAHLQSLLEDPDSLLELPGTEKLFRHLQILGAGVIEQALLRVEFRQPQHAFQRGLDLAQLLVHGDGFDRKALGGVGIAYTLEAIHRLFTFAETSVEVPHGIGNREVLGVCLEDLFVFSDGVLQLALLDKLLRSTEYLLFVEAKPKRHKSADSRQPCFPCP